jgi:hypothetical protein
MLPSALVIQAGLSANTVPALVFLEGYLMTRGSAYPAATGSSPGAAEPPVIR